MTELPWIEYARSYIGLKEVKGVKHNPELIRMLNAMGTFNREAKAWWRDDETPWCGLFVGYILGAKKRYVVREWYRAKEWASSLMVKLDRPAYGCIAVMDRSGGGHVGFVVGKDLRGNILVLGGNQSDAVNIAPFDPKRITGYYWPGIFDGNKAVKMRPTEVRYNLPESNTLAKVSENEA